MVASSQCVALEALIAVIIGEVVAAVVAWQLDFVSLHVSTLPLQAADWGPCPVYNGLLAVF